MKKIPARLLTATTLLALPVGVHTD